MDIKQLKTRIRKLALLEPIKAPVISCYLDLEHSWENPLLEVEQKAHLASMTLRGKARQDFEDAMTQIRDWLDGGLASETRGVAFFSRWGDAPFFLPIEFHRPLVPSFHVDSLPHIYPLVEMKDTFHRFIIVISTEETGRIIETNIGAITESIIAERPDLRQRIGREWTRQHYQNHRKNRNDRFLKEKIRILEELVRERDHSHIILAGKPNLVSRIRRALPKHLQEKVFNTMTVNPNNGVSAVVRDALEVFIEHEQDESVANVKRLEEALRSDGLGVVGYTQVKQALEFGQADLLLVQQELDDPEVREELTKQAIRTGVEVETVGKCFLLESLGGFGCLLRYRLPEQIEKMQVS